MASRALLATCALAITASAQVFNVLDYGAVGDGKRYDTGAIRATFAAAAAANGGTVLFPAGKTFLTGHFNISGNTVLQVQGRILGSPNSTDYILVEPLPWYGPDPGANPADPREWASLVQSWYVDNITITGGGVIDGNGALWWGCASNTSNFPCDGWVRPHGVRLVGATGIHIYNITVQNSPMWQLHLAYSSNVHVHDITVTAPASPGSHNTDGIDPDCSQNVLIERVYISTGDDCIAIKSGRDWAGRTYGRPSKNITVRDSVFGQGHGLSIGSEMSAGVEDVLFENLTADGIGTGIRLKSQRGRGGVISNIVYRNITLTNVGGEAVQATLNYSPNLPPANASGTPRMQGVLLDGVYSTGSKQGWFLDGLPESPLVNLTFKNVTVANVSSPKKFIVGCDNVVNSTCIGVSPSCPPCVTA